MKKIISAVFCAVFFTANFFAQSSYYGVKINGDNTASGHISGTWKLAPDSNNPTNYTITLDGTDGSVTGNGDLTVDTNTLFVDAAGNKVGIGTLTPSEVLHTKGGNIKIEGTSGTHGLIFPDGTKQTTKASDTPPAGNTGEVQFNDSGAFAADSNLFWDNTNKVLQTKELRGSSVENGNLILESTSNSTKGFVRVKNILTGGTNFDTGYYVKMDLSSNDSNRDSLQYIFPNTDTEFNLQVADVIGTGDLFFQANPRGAEYDSGYFILEGFRSAGIMLSTKGGSGIGEDKPIIVAPNRVEKMRVDSDSVIITGKPLYDPFKIEVDGGASPIVNEIWSDTASNAPAVKYLRSRGSKATPAAVQSGDEIGSFRFFGNDGTATSRQLDFGVRAAENWSSTNKGTTFFVKGTSKASASRVDWLIMEDGKLAIGSHTPSESLHTKDGNIKIEGTVGTHGLIFPDGTKQTTAFSAANTVIPRGYISGLLPENDTDTDHDVKINTGTARDGADTFTIEISTALVKQIDVNWTQGTNQGGFPSGLTLTANTWYHLFTIAKPDNTSDAGFDSSLTASNLLSDATGFTKYRRIGSVLTDSSSNIKNGVWFENGINTEFYFNDSSGSGSAANGILESSTPASSETDITINTPLGIRTKAVMKMQFAPSSPSLNNHGYRINSKSVPTSEFSMFAGNASVDVLGIVFGQVWTDTSSKVQHGYVSGSPSISNYELRTLGYIDPRA